MEDNQALENFKDVTKKEFKNKNNKKLEISDEKLLNAAGFAINEALAWDKISEILYKNYRKLNSQICVNALFAIELYLKSIFMSKGINISNKIFKHSIYSMYRKLTNEEKKEIKKDVKIDNVIYKKFPADEVVIFNSFEKELEFISNDFVNLRYEYEKFVNNQQIIVLPDFIMQLKHNCGRLAIKEFNETNKNKK